MQKPPVKSTYPKPISNWDGIPDNIDAVLHYTNGYTYFFKDENYYRFNDRTFAVSSILIIIMNFLFLNADKLYRSFWFPRSILQTHLSLAMLAIGGLAVGPKIRDIGKKWPQRPAYSDQRGWKSDEITKAIKTLMSVIW